MGRRKMTDQEREAFVGYIGRAMGSKFANRVFTENERSADQFQGRAEGFLNALAMIYGKDAANSVLYHEDATYSSAIGEDIPASSLFWND